MARNTGKQALVTGGAALIGSHIVDLMLREGWSVRISPAVNGEFRPGEMRHLTSDITRAQHMGYAPQVDLLTGIARYVEWIQVQGNVRDYFAAVEHLLRAKRIVHQVAAPAYARGSPHGAR